MNSLRFSIYLFRSTFHILLYDTTLLLPEPFQLLIKFAHHLVVLKTVTTQQLDNGVKCQKSSNVTKDKNTR